MIFTPTTKDQAKTAAQLISDARGLAGDNKTKIFIPNNHYTITLLCTEGQEPDFPESGRNLDKRSSINVLTSGLENSLKDIYEGNKQCNAKPNSLVPMFNYLSNAATHSEYGKLIIFLQVPWSSVELNDPQQAKTFAQIKESIDNMAKTQQVEEVIVFGLDSNASGSLWKSFQSLNGKILKNSSIQQNTQSLEEIHKKLDSN